MAMNKFCFSRVDGSVIGFLFLKGDNTIGGYSHFNEVYWKMEQGHLLFLNGDRAITTDFVCKDGVWVGNHCGRSNFHILKKVEDLQTPNLEITTLKGPLLIKDPTKHLIYTFASGSLEYKEMCNLFIQTLRTQGEYFEDIVVFTDTLEGFRGFDKRVYFIEMRNINSTQTSCLLKCLAPRFLLNRGYEKIIASDSDCLVTGKISSLFGEINEGCLNYVEKDYNLIKDESMNDVFYLEEEEIKKWKDLASINSGHVGFHGRDWVRFCDKWFCEYFSQIPNHKSCDQSSLNALILRRRVPGIRWSNFLIRMAREGSIRARDERTCLYHYLDLNKLVRMKSDFGS